MNCAWALNACTHLIAEVAAVVLFHQICRNLMKSCFVKLLLTVLRYTLSYAVLRHKKHVVQGEGNVLENAILSPTMKCFRFVCENLKTFPFGKRIVGKLDSWVFGDISSFKIKVEVYEKLAKM